MQTVDAIAGNVDGIAQLAQTAMNIGGCLFFILNHQQTHSVLLVRSLAWQSAASNKGNYQHYRVEGMHVYSLTAT
ncbi:hypothetical protein PSCICO_08970 [Pseudomonas cichorii]|nr:hypothetical protein PSCICO_08970 [Pseudomonas cichorii]